jgi:transposase
MYEHYIALDWSQSNMAVARLTGHSKNTKDIDVKSDIKELQFYLKGLRGSKILTFEETDTSQWLYTELKDYVDEILVCDPYRNHLLKEGAKTDKIDAIKLVKLLKADMLKPVFHSGDDFIYLRKIVSAYEDVVKAGVRLQNQRFALFKSEGKSVKTDRLDGAHNDFAMEGIERGLEVYDSEKARYEEEFKRLSKKHKQIKLLQDIPGISTISAVKIVSRVVDPRRFEVRNNFLSYCGLIKLKRISGGKEYGKKNPRCCKTLKSVFKSAAAAVIPENRNNSMKEYYQYLIEVKKLSEHNARNAVARRIATLALGVLKTQKKFEPYRRLKEK